MRLVERDLIGTLKRGIKKPPKVIARRIQSEINAELERFLAPRRSRSLTGAALLKGLGVESLEALWAGMRARPFVTQTRGISQQVYDFICPSDSGRITHAAEAAMANRVDLMGSGEIELGPKIDWHKDYKSGYRWPPEFFRNIDYANPGRPSDIKFPWELSRLQWLIPAGQAYLLTGDESYALKTREVLEDWIASNPYAFSVNWACTMEAAMRIFSWTWFFHVFAHSKAWSDSAFRSQFIKALYLHGEFTERHFEHSDINGNHCTADAAALVFAGLFFGSGAGPKRWLDSGWRILSEELPRQVFADGVDFEASVAYHRLILELFFLPALYRENCGLPVPDWYKQRVAAMAQFTAAYSRLDGATPLWGDSDNARVLPFGAQHLNDHRYLPGIVGAAWGVEGLKKQFSGSRAEIFWLLGERASSTLPLTDVPHEALKSQAFPEGGFYIMRNARDHVFIDCGPLGLGGRGGHGHSDCLSFEAVLDGVHLISDCGSYLYTASYEERNSFRSTAYHNTPQIDGEELNRFISPNHLWNLHNDAHPQVRRWESGDERDLFCGAHTGYQRLLEPVTPVREIKLEHKRHRLTVRDEFEGTGEHAVQVPLHLAPGVTAVQMGNGSLKLVCGDQTFTLEWNGSEHWNLEIGRGRVSPSYGLSVPVTRLLWRREGLVNIVALEIAIAPDGAVGKEESKSHGS